MTKTANRLLLVAFLPFLGIGAACSTEDPEVERVGLKKLDVRDGYVGDGDGDATGKNGSDLLGTDSISVFSRTTHPLLIQWCKTCHATSVSPLFANPDPKIAHEALLTAQKVDFEDPSRSRIVLRLSAENHNCPAEGCASAGDAMQDSVIEWAKALAVSEEDQSTQPVSPGRSFSDAETMRIDAGNPPGVIRLEAEQGTLKAPMVMLDVGTASGAKVVHTPAGAGSINNVQTAAASNALGTILYDFEVTTQGTYRLHGLVNAPTVNNNAFWVRMDAGALQGWTILPNGATYGWDLADPAQDMGAALQFTLTPGTHRLEIRQREEQTKVDVLVLAADAAYNPADAKPPFRDITVLTFDLAEASGIDGLKMTVEVSDYSANAYLLKNPTLTVPTGSVKVKGLKLLINDFFLPQHATYTTVDQTISAPGGVLSTAALVALKDKGVDADVFKFLFETLEVAP